MIDYNQASRTYDHTRESSAVLVEHFEARVGFTAQTRVLDFGCGTGNYLDVVQRRYSAVCCGVEPSEGMLRKAMEKNPRLDVRTGDHRNIPFASDCFDFVFMTDVVHHVPDLTALFTELRRVLKSGGVLCVVTQSHEQIERRCYTDYFPSLPRIEKRRYPEIQSLVSHAQAQNLACLAVDILRAPEAVMVSDKFLRNVEEKNYSMFRLLEQEEFEAGLARLKTQQGRMISQAGTGDSLLWFKKGI